MELTIADHVWNRAAMESGGASPRAGDEALAALLLAHGLVMNGGVHHAIEGLSTDELAAAARGFAYFGVDGVGSLLTATADADGSSEDEVDRRYSQLIPGDAFLAARFEEAFKRNPDNFAPLETV